MKLRIITIAMLSIIAPSIMAAFAPESSGDEISIPQLPQTFTVGFTGYFLRPSFSNGALDYANFTTNALPVPNFFTSPQFVKYRSDWGWGGNVGYTFTNTANDINLTYFRLQTDRTAAVVGNPPQTVVQPLGSPLSFTIGSTSANIILDQVDLNVGQMVDVGCRLRLHPTVGLRYAFVEPMLNTTFTNSVSRLIQTTTMDGRSDYNGAGPVVGLDASYFVYSGIGLLAHANSSVLMGEIDSVQNVTTLGTNGGTLTNNDKVGSSWRVVPTVEGKLGADYTYLFDNDTNSNLTLEAGYQWTEYYDVIDTIITNAAFNFGSLKTSNFGMEGPYVSLVYRFM